VVVDGSTDGSAAALRELSVTFPLLVIEQPNLGRAAACNAGARAGSGEVLVFLDDDMEADPTLLAQHEHARQQGADVVIGHVPLHPDSPANLLSEGVDRWARERFARLTAPGARLLTEDYLTGQMSVPAELFWTVGAFDDSFTRDGLFGGEDIDLGLRVASAGHRIKFDPDAITYQFYDVDPSERLRRSREAGRSQQELIFKHPESAESFSRNRRSTSAAHDLVVAILTIVPAAAVSPVSALTARLVRSGRRGFVTRRLFSAVTSAEFKRGERSARRSWRKATVTVLAYHAIADLSDDLILAPYGVPPELLATQLDHLLARGRRFVDLTTVIRVVTEGAFAPEGATLLTFDDGYADLPEVVRSILEPRGIPAVVFAVSGEVGGTNHWDRRLGAGPLALLGEQELRDLSRRGIAVGAHGVTHRPLVSLDQVDLDMELRDSAEQLESIGLPRPVAVAYPHGQWNRRVARAAQAAGYAVGFTVAPGVIRRTAMPHALPRIEVHAGDSARDLQTKMTVAQWPAWKRSLSPSPLRTRLVMGSHDRRTLYADSHRVRPCDRR